MAICFISHTFPKNVNNRTWRSLATTSGAAYHTAGLTIKMKGSLQGAPFPIGWHATLLSPGGNSQLCSQYVCELDIQPLDFETIYQYAILYLILQTKHETRSYLLQPLNRVGASLLWEKNSSHTAFKATIQHY